MMLRFKAAKLSGAAALIVIASLPSARADFTITNGPPGTVGCTQTSTGTYCAGEGVESEGDDYRPLIRYSDPSDSQVRTGNVYYNSGRYDEAIEHYQTALRLNPNNRTASQNLKDARARKAFTEGYKAFDSAPDAAIESFKRVLELDPGNTAAADNLRSLYWNKATHAAYAYWRNRQYAAAEQKFREAQRLRPAVSFDEELRSLGREQLNEHVNRLLQEAEKLMGAVRRSDISPPISSDPWRNFAAYPDASEKEDFENQMWQYLKNSRGPKPNYREALDKYRQVLLVDPTDYSAREGYREARFLLAREELSSRPDAKFKDVLDQALKRYPKETVRIFATEHWIGRNTRDTLLLTNGPDEHTLYWRSGGVAAYSFMERRSVIPFPAALFSKNVVEKLERARDAARSDSKEFATAYGAAVRHYAEDRLLTRPLSSIVVAGEGAYALYGDYKTVVQNYLTRMAGLLGDTVSCSASVANAVCDRVAGEVASTSSTFARDSRLLAPKWLVGVLPQPYDELSEAIPKPSSE